MEVPIESLLSGARKARNHAYAPYSAYLVGASLVDVGGRVFSACNVENASYGASMCAERAAIFKMVSEGCTRIAAMAVITENGGPPCGICLQVMREFSDLPSDLQVYCSDSAGVIKSYTLADLLPVQFELSSERSR